VISQVLRAWSEGPALRAPGPGGERGRFKVEAGRGGARGCLLVVAWLDLLLRWLSKRVNDGLTGSPRFGPWLVVWIVGATVRG
jgi:hypothetical protein